MNIKIKDIVVFEEAAGDLEQLWRAQYTY